MPEILSLLVPEPTKPHSSKTPQSYHDTSEMNLNQRKFGVFHCPLKKKMEKRVACFIKLPP